ncbi:MAG: hypothetical protein KDA68_08245 [Planctomycetaceae bacterium]|nr:hypothetical protein [Planctomycetaceae bacterium]
MLSTTIHASSDRPTSYSSSYRSWNDYVSVFRNFALITALYILVTYLAGNRIRTDSLGLLHFAIGLTGLTLTLVILSGIEWYNRKARLLINSYLNGAGEFLTVKSKTSKGSNEKFLIGIVRIFVLLIILLLIWMATLPSPTGIQFTFLMFVLSLSHYLHFFASSTQDEELQIFSVGLIVKTHSSNSFFPWNSLDNLEFNDDRKFLNLKIKPRPGNRFTTSLRIGLPTISDTDRTKLLELIEQHISSPQE